MKQASRFLALFTLFLLFIIVPSHVLAQSFEGVIDFALTSESGNGSLTYMVKGSNVRVETEGRQGMKVVFLIDVKENKTYMIMDPMKMYMETPQPTTEESSDKPKFEISKTGKTQTILGYACEEYLVKDGDKQTNVWVTKDLGTFELFRMGGGRQRNNVDAWQKAIGKSGFPLLATTKMGDKEAGSLKAIKVEKKSVDDALFKIPEGYQKFDNSMMRRPRQ